MASKCLIVATLPDEMNYLFSYNPIIEINVSSPAEQLLDIFENYSTYGDLIERNYEEVLLKHTWTERVKEIEKYYF